MVVAKHLDWRQASQVRLDLEIRYLGVYDKEESAIKAGDFTLVKSAATFKDRTRSRSLNTMAY